MAVPAAVRAFGGVAEQFDERFGEWASVAAQRRAVRRYLLGAFPRGARVLELAGGTGEDALFLNAQGRRVLLTDGAEAMVHRAQSKARSHGVPLDAVPLVLEDLDSFAAGWQGPPFDGVYSNFAGLNCVRDLAAVGRALARIVVPGAPLVLVLFGPLPPGEMLVQLLRGTPAAGLRRRARGAVPAKIAGHEFRVYYHRPAEIAASFQPWFELRGTRGIGVFVPPSAAEPFVSRVPLLVRGLELLDRLAALPLARLGDHVLFHLERTTLPLPAGNDCSGERFRVAYAEQRAAEGRHVSGAELPALPYVRSGPHARAWSVRARSFETLLTRVVRPMARTAGRPLRAADLGAGQGWLAYRLAREGHDAVALDLRVDAVDGLGCARAYDSALGRALPRCAGSFDALPLRPRSFDLVVFNASLHYAVDLERVLAEATALLRPGGRIVVVDSPFYRDARAGGAMVAEKLTKSPQVFGPRAAALTALPFVEYLTRDRLRTALALPWRRHRVWYPLWYEWRPVAARLRGARAPSRFDVWEAVVA